jgi:4-amino-4-deoxy-L-arabinose transferase-like glycosyltransferase
VKVAPGTDAGILRSAQNDNTSGWMKCGLARVMVVVFVCLTAAVSLGWSHAKLMSQDEMYQFQTDSVGSLTELVQVQKSWPISLDPLLDHALAHGAMQVFGVGAFAERLPALAGFLLMQVCLFFLVRNWAGDRAGVVAAAFPAVTATLYYSAEGRPYGLLLGLYALALLCWQIAVREPTSQMRDVGHPTGGRGWALAGLAVAIAAAVNAHYFGILLLVPVCAAEAWRTLARRRIDWAMCGAIFVGMLGFLAARPYMKAAGEFRKNYYNGGGVGLHDITRAYRTLFVDYTQMAMRWQHVWMMALVLFALGLVWGCWRVWRSGEIRIAGAEWVLLLALAALPFCGYLLARFVTHSIEVRYVLGALVALSAMLGLAVSPWLKRDAVFNAVLVVLGLGIVLGGAVRIRAEQRKTAARLESLVLPAEVKAALAASADGRLYVQDMGAFEEDRIYEPDAGVKARMTLVYSSAEELRWNRHDTMALTAMHLQHFTGLPVVSYESVNAEPGEHVFVLFHTGWDWTDQAFAADGAQVRVLGKAMSGDVVAVRFR